MVFRTFEGTENETVSKIMKKEVGNIIMIHISVFI